MPEIYVSVDVETDGPIPGPHSLLSLGAAAFRAGNRVPIATYEINLQTLPGAEPDPETKAWWDSQDPAVWEHIRRDPQSPETAIPDFCRWARGLPGNPVLVTYPTWDYLWVHWYCIRFAGKNPFGLSGLDVKSYAFGLFDIDRFKDSSKKNFPKSVFEGAPPHTHKGLDDAVGQGVMFINMHDLKRARRRSTE